MLCPRGVRLAYEKCIHTLCSSGLAFIIAHAQCHASSAAAWPPHAHIAGQKGPEWEANLNPKPRLTSRRKQSGMDWKRRASATVLSRSTARQGFGCRLDATCRPRLSHSPLVLSTPAATLPGRRASHGVKRILLPLRLGSPACLFIGACQAAEHEKEQWLVRTWRPMVPAIAA